MSEQVKCKHSQQATELMSMALDGLLGPDDERRLEHHLAACPACQAEWKAMQQVSTVFEQAPMIGPPLGFAIRIERRLNEKAKKRRRAFGGLAVLTGSLSLAGVTLAAVMLLVLGILTWQSLASSDVVQQSTGAVSQMASGMGLVGKGASLFLKDLLLRYGPPLVFLLGASLAVLAGVWTWLFIRRPGNSHHNGYI